MPNREQPRPAARPGHVPPGADDSTQEAWMELKGRPGPDVGLLYLGGPVDFNQEDHRKAWQHWPDWELTGLYPYCPRCECAGLTDDQIMEKNRKALMGARLAIFDLRSHSVGTPIELYLRLWRREKDSILIGSRASVFIRVSADRFGGILAPHPDAALHEALNRFGVRSRQQSPRGAKGKSR